MPIVRDMTQYTLFDDVLVNLNTFNEHKGAPDENGCIPYVSNSLHAQGYHMVSYHRKIAELIDGKIAGHKYKKGMITAHRLAMMEKLGRKLDEKECVIHTCHVPNCVNPDHMIIGDRYTRSQYQVNWPASRPKKVAKQSRQYKYTDDEIKFLRENKRKEIASKFNITLKQASRLKQLAKENYKWLE